MTAHPDPRRALGRLLAAVLLVAACSSTPAGAPGRPSTVYPADGRKWLALDLPGSHAVRGARGKVTRIIELRGWLDFVGPACSRSTSPLPARRQNAREPDWHYNLELDPAWIDHLGIADPNLIIRPGNVLNWPTRRARPGDIAGHEKGQIATGSDWTLIASPIVHVEVASWDPARHQGEVPPPWPTLHLPGCSTDVRWPFDPRRPDPRGPALAVGQYVRMVGSLVTDDPHVRVATDNDEEADYGSAEQDIHGIVGGDTPERLAARVLWQHDLPRTSSANPARWTELHPADLVQVLAHRPRTEQMVAVLAAAPPDLPPGELITLDAVVKPAVPVGPGESVRVNEVVGEATSPTVTDRGSHAAPPSRVTVEDGVVRLHVRVGRRAPGFPSAFEAVYRITVVDPSGRVRR